MSVEHLDLDGIEERHGKYATEQDCGPCFWDNPHDCTTLALVAEVRRLRGTLLGAYDRGYADGYNGMPSDPR